MRITLFLLVMLVGLAQAQPLIIRDGIRTGNRPGLVVAAFAGNPVIGGNRITGNYLTDPDSTGRRDTIPDWPIVVNWSKIDTVRVDSLPRRLVLMAERLAAGVFFAGEMTDSLIRADSVWVSGEN